jgi:DNA (cytosine-5)-methyltransferase 1
MNIALGLDCDPDAAETYEANFPEAAFVQRDIRSVTTRSLEQYVGLKENELLLFAACAPCQPFSKQRRKKRRNDLRATLLGQVLRFVVRYQPHFIFFENVPGIQHPSLEERVFKRVVARLRAMGYAIELRVVESRRYGVPQRRRRLTVIGSRVGPVSFPKETHGPEAKSKRFSTVWEWIGNLPPIRAGQTHSIVPNHRAANLSPLNLRRIAATPRGGGRMDWPSHLKLRCHRGYNGHSDVYGRMKKDEPATGLTTRCISLSNGRFGHPTQNRAISIREAACLQTFDRDFVFLGSMGAMARQIGNAVPVVLAQAFGREYQRMARRAAEKW